MASSAPSHFNTTEQTNFLISSPIIAPSNSHFLRLGPLGPSLISAQDNSPSQSPPTPPVSPLPPESNQNSPPPLSPPSPPPPLDSPPPNPPISPTPPPPPTEYTPAIPPPVQSQTPPPSILISTPPPPSTTSSHPSPVTILTPLPPPSPSPGSPPIPPSPALSHSPPPPHPPRSASTNRSSGLASPGPAASLSNSITVNPIVIAAGGVVIAILLIVCLICSRKKKKDPGYPPPKGGDQYYYGSSQWTSPQATQWTSRRSLDLVVNLPPPPGVMGTPVGGQVGGWGAPPPPANTSSEYSSAHSGQHVMSTQPPSPSLGIIGSKNQFTYENLAIATSGFAQANLLGQGGFGLVHKGVLPNGREVAVKSLKSGSGQGEREFQAEVEIISRVHHRHLVSLVGYCIADRQRMLVYEFVPNKTLEFHLHGKGQPVMDWAIRLRIALGSAKGLAYLHEDCHPRIIHRDVKAANILLDSNCEAMVADFGLAKLTSDNYTHVSTRVMGTFGYLAPEYAASGKLTEKSDVFSFGVMLLELITGRRPIDLKNNPMDDSLVDWARPLMTKSLEDGIYDELVDPRLEDNYVPHEMARMIACAAASIRHSARRRPKMSQIVLSLDGAGTLEDLNEGVKPGQSTTLNPNGTAEPYDTRAYDADMMMFRRMVMSSQDFNSSEYGATSEYGLNPSESSNDSRDLGKTSDRQKL